MTRKMAMVTGAGSGIGRATVELFLERGWAVAGLDVNKGACARLRGEAEIAVAEKRLEVLECDVSEERQVASAVERAVEWGGDLHCMVNNAGIGGAFGPVTEMPVEDWDRTFAVLSRGVFLGVKHSARVMSGQGGSIVNVASIAALVGDAGLQAYSAAKASVLHMSRVFATELGPRRIRVNAVCPGPVATPLNPRAATRFEGSELARVQPLPFPGQPEHLARAIYFLGSDESSFVTGQYLAVDGGLEGAGPRIGQFMGTDPRYLRAHGFNEGTSGREAASRQVEGASPDGGVGPRRSSPAGAGPSAGSTD